MVTPTPIPPSHVITFTATPIIESEQVIVTDCNLRKPPESDGQLWNLVGSIQASTVEIYKTDSPRTGEVNGTHHKFYQLVDDRGWIADICIRR